MYPDLFLEEAPCGSIHSYLPSVGDHSIFAFWVVANGRFDCIVKMFLIRRWILLSV